MRYTSLLVLCLVAVAARESASKYTTLLEDEESVNNEPSSAEPRPTPVTYGRLIYDQQALDPSPAPQQSQPASRSDNRGGSGNDSDNVPKPGAGSDGHNASLLSRLYSTITYYLPSLAPMTDWRQGGTNAASSSDYELHAKTNVSVSSARDVSRQVKDERNQETGGGDETKIGERSNSISKSLGNSLGNNNDKIDDDANRDNQQALNNDKQVDGTLNVKVSIDRKQIDNQDEDNQNSDQDDQDAVAVYNNFVGQFGSPIEQLESSDIARERQQPPKNSRDFKRNQPRQYLIEDSGNSDDGDDTIASASPELDVDMSQMVPMAVELGNLQRYLDQDEQRKPMNRYNLMKQSELVMPMSSSDDIIVGASSRTTSGRDRQPESLLGKYIYAPTQHYYLNSIIPPTRMTSDSNQPRHVLASSGKHIQPGDHIYSSYGPDMPMKAAYVYQKEHNSIGGKTNDLYFLIMVGAFCMMAMTVVLAAGLFAYRIQQSRKSSQDTGYPTYGVVGPNNMSGKCGAASFVGGYFSGPSAGCGSSKSGSARHLAELYANSPNGTGGSDSGLNSLDRSSSNKKASSVSSLNEFHQSAASRAASSNFMTAASQDAARMYHYQHQKQQMIIADRNSGGRQTTASDLDSDDENDDGNYTVYECPGLASAHEMEIKNPLFNDDQSP